MQVLSETVAIGFPLCPVDVALASTGLDEVRAGGRDFEVRIGVGPLADAVPARVIGYAACLADVIRADLRKLAGRPPHIVIFSSAPKFAHVAEPAAGRTVTALVALAGALRLAGIADPIEVDLATAQAEVPETLGDDLEAAVRVKVVERAQRHGGGNCLRYALEHAAESMFGDLATYSPAPFRVTLGGATEALYWAVRMHVRAAALRCGLPLAPVAGLFVKPIKVPWYYPLSRELALTELPNPDAHRTLKASATAGNGGNLGLKREVEMTIRLSGDPRLPHLCGAIGSATNAIRFARNEGISLGPRLSRSLIGDP